MQPLSHKALPKVRFAHKYTANTYSANLINSDGMIEICAMVEGEISILADGKQHLARAGDITFRQQKSVHVEATEKHTHHTVGFYPGDALSQELWQFPDVIHAPQNFNDILCLIDKIIQTQHLTPNDHLKIAGLLLQLLAELCQTQNRSDEYRAPSDMHYVAQAKKYIFEHISEPILQKDIAAHLGISPEYLCSVFKKSEQCTIIRFINEIKLNGIRTMMESTHIPLNQAIQQYGFTDPNYVSKLYKKYHRQSITYAIKTLHKFS